MSTFTPNLNYEQVARGGDVGTWDTPTNSNWALSDLVVGGIATIAVNNSNVVLSAAQFQARNITFNSTLTGSIAITFPTSFTKSYEIQNVATGSSAFTVTLITTAAGGQGASCPPGQTIDVFNDGVNIKFKNLPPVGTYLDFAVTNVPIWLGACSVPPWLNCNGTSFSSATYPALAAFLGGTTLPDCRGTVSAALDQGVGRLTAGTSVGVITGAQTTTLGMTNLPASPAPVAATAAAPSATVGGQPAQGVPSGAGQTQLAGTGGGPGFFGATVFGGIAISQSAVTNNTANLGSATPVAVVQPTTVVGLRMIRAG